MSLSGAIKDFQDRPFKQSFIRLPISVVFYAYPGQAEGLSWISEIGSLIAVAKTDGSTTLRVVEIAVFATALLAPSLRIFSFEDYETAA